MSNKQKKPKRSSWFSSILILIAVVFCCLLFFYVVDVFFNGLTADVFVNTFTVTDTYQNDDGSLHSYQHIDWNYLKSWIMIAFLFLAIMFTFLLRTFSRRAALKEREALLSSLSEQVSACLADENGTFTAFSKEFTSVGFDILKLRSQAREKTRLLEQEMQQKNDLITYLAHDLKTPLASVIGYLCLLDESPSLPADLREQYIGITLEKAYRLEQLINEFFEITRYNLHSIVVNPGRVHLKAMLLQLADEFYPILEAEGKSIEVDAPADLILIGDADKLARVFNNILKNAAAYSYPNTKISVRVQQKDPEVFLYFTNQGDPIPERQRETIFEKFYRLDGSRSTKTGGSGLGLAIAKEIVDAHHGKIWVESSLEQTTFTVRLPLKQDAAALSQNTNETLRKP
ncbi:MAG: HAMP domain-containing sensor histidine kinase [Eubacteriales bacterium]|nr:HAMP domain-containing sensor histidine kinase [Eubacteriales bacterium]